MTPGPEGRTGGVAPAPTGASASASGSASGPVTGLGTLWNIPNMLTMLRLLIVPVFAALLLAGGGHDPKWRSVAWAAFALADRKSVV